LTNISSITRTGQTEHIKNKAKIITVAKVFKEALEIIIPLETIAVFREAKAVINITYLHI
jgi:hypothetical protein